MVAASVIGGGSPRGPEFLGGNTDMSWASPLIERLSRRSGGGVHPRSLLELNLFRLPIESVAVVGDGKGSRIRSSAPCGFPGEGRAVRSDAGTRGPGGSSSSAGVFGDPDSGTSPDHLPSRRVGCWRKQHG